MMTLSNAVDSLAGFALGEASFIESTYCGMESGLLAPVWKLMVETVVLGL